MLLELLRSHEWITLYSGRKIALPYSDALNVRSASSKYMKNLSSKPPNFLNISVRITKKQPVQNSI